MAHLSSPEQITFDTHEHLNPANNNDVNVIFEEENLGANEGEVYKLPRIFVFLTIFLFSLGLGLIVAGLVMYYSFSNPSRFIAFWIIGSFCFIPGSYYLHKLIAVEFQLI